MMLRVGVKQASYHPLILRVVFLCFGLEEFDAAFTQRDGDFDPFVLKHQILRPGQEVSDNLRVSHRFVCVFDSRAHR